MPQLPRKEKATPAREAKEGAPIPAWVAPDLDRLLALPEAARAALWDVIGPSLNEKVVGAAAEARLERFRKLHDAPQADVTRAVRVARHLVRAAAVQDLDRDRFAEEIAALHPSPVLGEVLLAGYEPAKALIRREMARSLLAEHGAVVEGVDWRVDVVTGAKGSARMRLPVAFLTLKYREGTRRERLTVQLLPDSIQELRRLCERMSR